MAFAVANIIPIYATSGEPVVFLSFPHLFSRGGEWVGWVTPSRDVYSVLGHYVGYLTNDPRILRRRSDMDKPRLAPPLAPARIRVPAQVPLARMMSEVPAQLLDVLMDEPERLHTSDLGDLRADMD